MKRTVALIMCLLTLTLCFAGCGVDKDYKGQQIPIYFSEQVLNFDPAHAVLDSGSTQIISMLFEGLTKLDANGKVVDAMASGWEIIEEEEQEYYAIEVYIDGDTGWSDGRPVTADDYVYAWKRILNPSVNSEAAVLLYDIKNAITAKNGDCSIDDVGIYAAGTNVLTVVFDTPVTKEMLANFKETCASPALYPLRDDVVSKGKDWATNVSLMVTNGPFTLRNSELDMSFTLERNPYYRRDAAHQAFTVSVTPFRLITAYGAAGETIFDKDVVFTGKDQIEKYNNNESFYMGGFDLDARKEYADEATVVDTMSTHTYVFNTTKAPFDNAQVRQALSLAIDRNEIVNIVTFGKAASGMIPEGVKEAGSKDSFRQVGGELIAASADLNKAKELLRDAGVSGGAFELLIRPSAEDRAVAEYVAKVWGQLGFDVTVKEGTITTYRENDYDYYDEEYLTAYQTGAFDVIAIDWQTVSSDAFATLAPFAVDFSGRAMDLSYTDENGEYDDDIPHVTGYDSADYNKLMADIFAIKDRTERAALLHQAEEMLVADMPVMPLYVHQTAYVASKDLKGITKDSYFGFLDMTKVNLTTYSQYITEETDPIIETEKSK